MAFKLKTEKVGDKTYALMGASGKPLYLNEDTNEEIELDAGELHGKVRQTNAEAMRHRQAKEELEGKIKLFEGIDDPEAARKALEITKNLDDKKLIEAGKVDEMKAAATRALQDKYDAAVKNYDAQIKERDNKLTNLTSELDTEIIGGQFARSKFIGEKVAIPRTFLEASFRKNFKRENGKAVAYDDNGQPIYGKADPSNPAPFDEAIEILIGRHPDRDSILKGNQNTGSGAGHGGRQGGNGKTISRSEWNAKPPMERAKIMADANRPEIVD